jgi:hypothetical protein
VIFLEDRQIARPEYIDAQHWKAIVIAVSIIIVIIFGIIPIIIPIAIALPWPCLRRVGQPFASTSLRETGTVPEGPCHPRGWDISEDFPLETQHR